MNIIRTSLILIISFICFFSVYAQEKIIIRGRVIDSGDKTTIIGANIVEYDKEDRIVNGTITNVNGDFVLEMTDPSHVVKVSVVGYQAQEIKIEPSKPIIVELESADTEIGEITVTAGSARSGSLTNIEDRDRAFSSVRIDLMDVKDVGVMDAADALQGKISGLDIIAASGDPGAGSQLVIRGLSSMGNSQPLIVIDGIPQFKVSSDLDLSSADAEDIGELINIAVQDISSIEVLKDAAATSVYGSQGADGVLLIETNKGRLGKVKFDYQYKNSFTYQPPPIPLLNGDEYVMLQLEAWHNSRGVYELPREIAYDRDFIDFYNYSANTDWINELTRKGITHDNYFSISGGGNKTRYFTSFSYVDEEGTTIGTNDQRFSIRTNLDYFLSTNLQFQIKFNYNSNFTESNLSISGRNVREMAYIKSPNMSIWEYDSNGNLTGDYFTPYTNYQGNGVTYYNPIALVRLGTNDRNLSKIENTYLVRYRINEWITFRETISFQFQGLKSKQFIPHNTIGADWINSNVNRAIEGNNRDQGLRTETQVTFVLPVQNKNHLLSGAISWITDQASYGRMSVESSRIPSTDIKDPAIDAHINNISTTRGERRTLSGLSNINYKYLDRYMIQTILRADANSSFGANNRWGLFKGISLGWRFSSEPFLSSLGFLDESKLRLSWGVSGRRPSDVYARFASYESTSTGGYIISPGVAPTSIQLNNLRWETITSYNFGIDLNMFNNLLYIVGDIYQKVTTDILFDRYEIPYSSGFNSLRYFNGGEMTNKGWELMLDLSILRKKDLRWSVNFNSSQNINSFDKLPNNFNTERSTAIGNGQYPQRIMEGEPIGSFFGFRYLGVWSSDEDVISTDAEGNILYDSFGVPVPLRYTDSYNFKGGDPIYEDVNHDARIDLNDVVYIGDSNPNFLGGIGTNFRFKNFDFAINFHYRLGFDIINMVALQTEGMNDRNNQSKAVLWRWRIEGQNEIGMLPRAYMNHPANNLGSDRYVERGDFLRLNNLKLGYRMNTDLCKKIGVESVNLVISGRKLLTITNYSGQDPEVSQNASNPFWIGIDRATTPPPKIITLSLSVGF